MTNSRRTVRIVLSFVFIVHLYMFRCCMIAVGNIGPEWIFVLDKIEQEQFYAQNELYTLLGTNISPEKPILKTVFLFPRWDMLVPQRVYHSALIFASTKVFFTEGKTNWCLMLSCPTRRYRYPSGLPVCGISPWKFPMFYQISIWVHPPTL